MAVGAVAALALQHPWNPAFGTLSNWDIAFGCLMDEAIGGVAGFVVFMIVGFTCAVIFWSVRDVFKLFKRRVPRSKA